MAEAFKGMFPWAEKFTRALQHFESLARKDGFEAAEAEVAVKNMYPKWLAQVNGRCGLRTATFGVPTATYARDWTAGFSHGLHLPGQAILGYPFLTHSHMWTCGSFQKRRWGLWPPCPGCSISRSRSLAGGEGPVALHSRSMRPSEGGGGCAWRLLWGFGCKSKHDYRT